MSEAIVLQLVAGCFGVVIALLALFGTILTVLSNRTRQHARAASNNSAQTRDQVTNDHEINLRDDLDAKFRSLNNRLDRQGRQINRLFRNDRELAEEIEQTRDPRRKE